MVGSNSSGHFDHPDLHVSRIKKDVADVREIGGAYGKHLDQSTEPWMKQSWSIYSLEFGPNRYCQLLAESSPRRRRSIILSNIQGRSFGERVTQTETS